MQVAFKLTIDCLSVHDSYYRDNNASPMVKS